MDKRGWKWANDRRILDGPGHGPAELGRARLQAGKLAAAPVAGEVRDRRPLVPDGTKVAARPGGAALVHATAADGLTGRDLQ
jgi:hypothetical protein